MRESHTRPVHSGDGTGKSPAGTHRDGRSDARTGALRLLAVSGVFPYPATNGYAMRTWAVLRSLTENGHTVDLLTFGKPADLEGEGAEVRRICRTVEVVPHPANSLASGADYLRRLAMLPLPLPYAVERFRSAAMKGRIRAWLQARSADAILCDTPYPLVNLPEALPAPLILNNHNIEHVLLERYLACEPNTVKRLYARLEWRKLRRWERQACSRADLVMVCSEHDRMAITSLFPELPVAVVPNTVDVDRYQPASPGDSLTVLYSGGMDWHPNRDAVQFFVTEILPQLRALVPGVKFVVAGRSPSDKFRQRLAGFPEVEFTGTLPDLRGEIARAGVCVVPLRIGSGTRLKIIEAAAMGKAVVSTRIGAEGLEFLDGKEILLADEPGDFAEAVAALLSDASRRHALGHAARRRVEGAYGRPALRTALRQALSQLVHAPLTAGEEPRIHWSAREVRP